MTRRRLFGAALLLALLSYPPHWYPMPIRLKLTEWFGAADFRALPYSVEATTTEAEVFCPPDPEGWRDRQSIEGVEIGNSAACVADNPFAVAAFVRGTNNVSQATLLKSGLTADAVEKGRDLDGDGDPDEIHIRLEVVELNGGSALLAGPVTQYEIAATSAGRSGLGEKDSPRYQSAYRRLGRSRRAALRNDIPGAVEGLLLSTRSDRYRDLCRAEDRHTRGQRRRRLGRRRVGRG